jgi:hypothetical protein
MKLELEKIYKEYCEGDVEREEDKFINMMKTFIEFRLEVSGGNKCGCMVSMTTVTNFLNEIFLFDNMMDDWGGCYRGDFCWEKFECLEKLVNKSDLEKEIKNKILEGYRKEYGMDKE